MKVECACNLEPFEITVIKLSRYGSIFHLWIEINPTRWTENNYERIINELPIPINMRDSMIAVGSFDKPATNII